MLKTKFCLLATTLALQAWAPQSLAGIPGSMPAPVIESVALRPGTITLTGNFYGTGAPLLMLGKHQLEISESSPTQVVAKLPNDLPAATYRLSINGPRASSTSLYVLIPRALDSVQVVSADTLPLR